MGYANNNEIKICYGCMKQMPNYMHVCPNCGYDNSIRQNGFDILPEGTILHERYMIGKVIGRGGFGVTYLGYDFISGIRLAIKEYFPIEVSGRVPESFDVISLSGVQEDFNRGCQGFRNEAETLSRFNSPYIVRVRDFFYEHNTAYIVMEYVEGKNLTDEVEKAGGRMPWQRILNLVKPLIFVLSELHNESLIHRDIKPDNLIVVNGGEELEHLVLLDFGSARSYASSASNRITAMITPGYAPIEQYSQVSRQGPYTDIYALCCTIYSAITGRKPPASTERLEKHADLPSIRSLGIDIPDYLEKALYHGMELRSNLRPQTMKELFFELYPGDNFIDDKADNQETKPINDDTQPVNLPEGWQRPIYEAAKAAMMPQTVGGYMKALNLLERVPGWRSADYLADYCRQQLNSAGIDISQCDYIYQDAKAKTARDTYDGYMTAINMLKRISGWRDADELAAKFESLVAERNRIFESGNRLMADNDIQSLKGAIEKFQLIPGWLNADELAADCQRKINDFTQKIIETEKVVTIREDKPVETDKPDVDHPEPPRNYTGIWIALIILFIVGLLIADYYIRKDNSIINLFFNKVVLPFLSKFS